MKVENISKGKPIDIGPLTILPGETKKVPAGYESSPVLTMYADLGFLRIAPEESGAVVADSVPDTEVEAVPEVPAESAPEDTAEALRKARLASLNSLDDTALGKLAEELGISPADCRDVADMRKKVKAALKK